MDAVRSVPVNAQISFAMREFVRQFAKVDLSLSPSIRERPEARHSMINILSRFAAPSRCSTQSCLGKDPRAVTRAAGLLCLPAPLLSCEGSCGVGSGPSLCSRRCVISKCLMGHEPPACARRDATVTGSATPKQLCPIKYAKTTLGRTLRPLPPRPRLRQGRPAGQGITPLPVPAPVE